MRRHRDTRRMISFSGSDGRVYKKLPLVESQPTGNRHRNRRRPNGPVCACGEPWQPVCPNVRCAGNSEPRRIMRIEKYGKKSSETRRAA